MRFKDLKIGKKQTIGFGSVILVTVVLGSIAYYMFNKIDREVTQLNNRFSPVTQTAAKVENQAWNAIMQEKNYVIYEKEEYEKATLDMVTQVNQTLKTVDSLAQQFNDSELADLSKTANDAALLFNTRFIEAVQIMKQKKDQIKLMDEYAKLTSDQSEKFLLQNEDEYSQTLKVMQSANIIKAQVLEMRLDVFAYSFYNDSQYYSSFAEKYTSAIQTKIGRAHV